MKKLFLSAILFAVVIVGCAPAAPQAIPTPVPAPVYEFKHEIIDTTKDCRPDESEQARIFRDYIIYVNPSSETPAVGAIQEALRKGYRENGVPIASLRATSQCVTDLLTAKLSKEVEAGWELTSTQPLEPNAYELGIEYVFITIWRKELK